MKNAKPTHFALFFNVLCFSECILETKNRLELDLLWQDFTKPTKFMSSTPDQSQHSSLLTNLALRFLSTRTFTSGTHGDSRYQPFLELTESPLKSPFSQSLTMLLSELQVCCSSDEANCDYNKFGRPWVDANITEYDTRHVLVSLDKCTSEVGSCPGMF